MPYPPFNVAMVVPTGVGAQIGGYGGDATKAMCLIASTCDTLITHPNVANAAAFQNLPENALYVEGYGLDQFFKGQWALSPVRGNKIGVVFDAAIEPRMLTLHLNTINAVSSIYQTHIVDHILTDSPIDLTCTIEESGASSGKLNNPQILLNACQSLIAKGADALAICLTMPQLDETTEQHYRQGHGIDPIGGLEAIVSHLVVSTLGIPCAHVPVFAEADVQPEMETVLDPRVAPEFIVSTFLPCALMGLRRAPQFKMLACNPLLKPTDITVNDVNALVLPADCLGGLPALSAIERQIPLIAVAENSTTMSVTAQNWGMNNNHIIYASTYYEAVGLLTALRNGWSVR